MKDYRITPGLILKKYMSKYDYSQKELAKLVGSSERHISEIVNSKTKISYEFAYKLESIFKEVNAEFWMDLERDYQLKVLRRKNKFKEYNLKQISKDFFLDDIFKNYYRDIYERADQLLIILGAKSYKEAYLLAEEFNNEYNPSNLNDNSLYVWFKNSEMKIQLQNDIDLVNDFDKDLLNNDLHLLKDIIKSNQDKVNIDKIREFLNNHGIYLVVTDSLKGLPIKGSTQYTDDVISIFLTPPNNTNEFYNNLITQIFYVLNNNLELEDIYLTFKDDNNPKVETFINNFM